jgi:hypothetical protein
MRHDWPALRQPVLLLLFLLVVFVVFLLLLALWRCPVPIGAVRSPLSPSFAPIRVRRRITSVPERRQQKCDSASLRLGSRSSGEHGYFIDQRVGDAEGLARGAGSHHAQRAQV